MSGSVSTFVSNVLPYAQQVSANTGLPLDLIIAQSAQETGWGTSNAAVNGNNYFGISPGGSLASYPNIAAGFQAYANTINNNFSGAASQGTVANILNYLQYGGSVGAYAASGNGPDPNYAPQVAALVPQIDNALAGLGISGSASSITASGAGAPGTTVNPASGSNCFVCNAVNNVTSYIGRFGVMILAVVILGVGTWMLAKK